MNKVWFKAAGIRAIKTMAQAALSTIGATGLITEVNWLVVLSATGMAGILSLLTSIKGLPEVELQNSNCLDICDQQAIREENGEFSGVDYKED